MPAPRTLTDYPLPFQLLLWANQRFRELGVGADDLDLYPWHPSEGSLVSAIRLFRTVVSMHGAPTPEEATEADWVAALDRWNSTDTPEDERQAVMQIGDGIFDSATLVRVLTAAVRSKDAPADPVPPTDSNGEPE